MSSTTRLRKEELKEHSDPGHDLTGPTRTTQWKGQEIGSQDSSTGRAGSVLRFIRRQWTGDP